MSVDTLQNYKLLAEMIPELEELLDTGIVTKTTTLAIMKNFGRCKNDENKKIFDRAGEIYSQFWNDEMLDEISQKIAKGMPAILILVTVGAMVGTWMAAGTIPLMIYYGVQIVNPKFLLVTAFLISNTIKITIFSRKREIEIMRLVGASNFSIKQPFAIEGLIIGIFGSIKYL